MSKRKLQDEDGADAATVRQQRAAFLASMSRGISPPQSSRSPRDLERAVEPFAVAKHPKSKSMPVFDLTNGAQPPRLSSLQPTDGPAPEIKPIPRLIPSPFQLTEIRDLPVGSNINTVSLHDILGNPLIKEAWIFNFCFDVDWMMQHFDPDVRSTVQVKIVHGSWKKEDGNKIGIDDACRRWSNVDAAAAYLPDPFGTHHSKMFVLLTHDDCVEVIIHTANMLTKDWTNMTQAVWRSGPLPLGGTDDGALECVGTGTRFKYDLLSYLKAYKRPTKSLLDELRKYDFSSVKGALVASVPAKIDNSQSQSSTEQHLWGYPQLREVLSQRWKSTSDHGSSRPYLIAQVSSIATLHNGWLETLIDAFSSKDRGIPHFSIIYPTAPNVAASLDGYEAGGSIHTKAQAPAHLKQIENLRPHLQQWTNNNATAYSSQRHLAAPHIKTYVQLNVEPTKKRLDAGVVKVEWAFVTSANLSTQAWGGLPRREAKEKTKTKVQGKKAGLVHIQSFEIGVLVWPELFASTEAAGATTCMVPVFGKDQPDVRSEHGQTAWETVIGLRMPYDLPLTPYGSGELPWSPHGTYPTPDSKGRVWLR